MKLTRAANVSKVIPPTRVVALTWHEETGERIRFNAVALRARYSSPMAAFAGVATSAQGGKGSEGRPCSLPGGMEFSLPQDGSFVVSWDINEKSRYGVVEGEWRGRQLRRNDRDILIASDVKGTSSVEGR